MTQQATTHETEERIIADTILRQLGGYASLNLMIGVKHMNCGDGFLGNGLPYLKIQFKAKAKNKAKMIIISLDRATDTYVVDFMSIPSNRAISKADTDELFDAMIEKTKISHHEDVYWSDMKSLFETETGLVLSVPVVRFG